MANRGYEKLAYLMARFPEYTICTSFPALGTRRLLLLQAEITYLQGQLLVCRNIDQEDDRKSAASTWKDFRELSDEEEFSQSQMLDEIFEKLDKYYALILQTKQVLELPAPQDSETRKLRDWLELDGNNFLQGFERDIYYPTDPTCSLKGLVSLHSNSSNDSFAQRLNDSLRPIIHRVFGCHYMQPIPDEESLGVWWEYTHRTFVVLADVVCAFLAIALPVTSCALLRYFHSTEKRLIIITVMSFLLSFTMSTAVQGRRVEVFAASIAFAAVQTAFLTGFA